MDSSNHPFPFQSIADSVHHQIKYLITLPLFQAGAAVLKTRRSSLMEKDPAGLIIAHEKERPARCLIRKGLSFPLWIFQCFCSKWPALRFGLGIDSVLKAIQSEQFPARLSGRRIIDHCSVFLRLGILAKDELVNHFSNGTMVVVGLGDVITERLDGLG